ncbi:MAG: hypothetical protein HC817_02030 [Saprospiraceae bacterium]|nr:hypothetical protein [Saprospiraceae bacterium]
MFKKIVFVALLWFPFSCQVKDDAGFIPIKQDFIQQYLALFPDETPLSIDNQNSTTLHIPTQEVLDSVRDFHAFFSQKLKENSSSSRAKNHANDFAKMQVILKNINLYLANSQTNPSVYDVRPAFERLINTNFMPLTKRLDLIYDKLAFVPDFYDAAKKQLKNVSDKNADLAIQMSITTYIFFSEKLPQLLYQEKKLTPQYSERLEFTKMAIKDYIAFVESFRLEKTQK